MDKNNLSPFTEIVSNEDGRLIMSGRSVYNVHQMRERLCQPSHYGRYLNPEQMEMADLDKAASVLYPEAEEETTKAAPLNLQQAVKRMRRPIGDVVAEIITIVGWNIQAGAMRLLGASIVRHVGLDGSFKGFLSAALPTCSLPSIVSLYPMPMGCRNFDIVPLANIINSLAAGVIKPVNDRSGHPPVSLMGATSLPNEVVFLRFDLFNHHCLTSAGPRQANSSVSTAAVYAVLRNGPLLCCTGRLGFALDFAQQRAKLEAADSGSRVDLVFGIPGREGDSSVENEAFLEFIQQISSVSSRQRLSVSHLFSQQHYGLIPKAIKCNTTAFLRFCERCVFPFPEQFVKSLETILLYVAEEEVLQDDTGGTLVAAIWARQEKLYQLMKSLAVSVWEPTGKTEEEDWHFLIQAFLLDIQAFMRLSLLEPHQYKMKPGEAAVIEGPAECDPNISAFNPGLICSGNGSQAALLYMKKATGDKKLTIEVVFKEMLVFLREMPELFLQAMGLRVVRLWKFIVILDALTGQIWCIRMAEHWLCKVYLVLKHRFPQNNCSAVPEADAPHCQPLFVQKPGEVGDVFDWDACAKGNVTFVVRNMVIAYHRCVEQCLVNPARFRGVLDRSPLRSSGSVDGGERQAGPAKALLKHTATVACFPGEPMSIVYRPPRIIDDFERLVVTRNSEGQWQKVDVG